MKHKLIKIFVFCIFYLPLSAQADDFAIELSSSPSPTEKNNGGSQVFILDKIIGCVKNEDLEWNFN